MRLAHLQKGESNACRHLRWQVKSVSRNSDAQVVTWGAVNRGRAAWPPPA
jgi:hypothetical protein